MLREHLRYSPLSPDGDIPPPEGGVEHKKKCHGFANVNGRDGAFQIMPPSARGDVVPKDDKGEYTIQGKLIYRSLEMYYVLERFQK